MTNYERLPGWHDYLAEMYWRAQQRLGSIVQTSSTESMSDNLERAEQHIRLAESTSNAEWSAAHALLALAFIGKEFVSGRS